MLVNVGSLDRIIRVVLGLGIIAAGLYFSSWFGLIGVVLLATAAIKFCPLYWTVKVSTVEKK
ncbi:MAG TPA: DUF2892 domain-containing protein [Leptospiraceae bacterium]|nr:DUF2892 domain-containing protein [Leptospiraceae bacterium]HMW05320.1 DUF2892 domain-containing protein [Leptospiraceae bacterium]HMX32923.1 DUF2892 domain-containing protein [Leptospiraceae bacterium]HMY31516.1 DUF2892 domain-containing protein [Leptospiraceae bacterium]HMZ66307.1 DUF2892 domain-containing protein [Leptospiraceae bacterium]